MSAEATGKNVAGTRSACSSGNTWSRWQRYPSSNVRTIGRGGSGDPASIAATRSIDDTGV